MDYVVTVINNLPHILQRDATHTLITNTQVQNFRGSKNKFHEFEHLLLNHSRPHQNRITDDHKLHYIQSLLRDEAIDFWQTLG